MFPSSSCSLSYSFIDLADFIFIFHLPSDLTSQCHQTTILTEM